MNLFRQYGIKEVADVTLYSIHRKKDGSNELYYVPALYLDTLKISSVEKSADGVWAEGGLGNGRLIHWDYGKQIDISLEDALCTPASLNLCWDGVLSADWKDAKVDIHSGISMKRSELKILPRMEKTMYPSFNEDRQTISKMLPHTSDTDLDSTSTFITKSSIVDGTIIKGSGMVRDKIYNWNMAIESGVKSVAVVPDRFFDVTGRSYPIDQERRVAVTNLPTYSNFRAAVVYRINNKEKADSDDAKIIFVDEVNETNPQNVISNELDNGLGTITNSLINYNFNRAITDRFIDKTNDVYKSDSLSEITQVSNEEDICNANYLAIVVDNNDDYYALIGKESNGVVTWYYPKTDVIVSQFKGIDMWLRFESLNTMIYFLITKYEKSISKMVSVSLETSDTTNRKVSTGITKVVERDDEKARAAEGKLWCYINPHTMEPYDDDYWFTQGEVYYKKSLTMAPKGKELKGKRITVLADEWPGVYMLVGETYIRDRETHEDERMQLKFPICKVKSDHTLTLQADGDPTVLNLNLEVARPKNGIMMELTTYEIAPKMMKGEDGNFYAVDGSTEVLSE